MAIIQNSGRNLMQEIIEQAGLRSNRHIMLVDMGRLFNTEFVDMDGDKVIFNRLIFPGVESQPTIEDGCTGATIKCIGSATQEITLKQSINELYPIHECRTIKFARANKQGRKAILNEAMAVIMDQKVELQIIDGLTKLDAKAQELTSDISGEEVVEGLLTLLGEAEETSGVPMSEFTVLVSPKVALAVQKQKLNCCTFLSNERPVNDATDYYGVADLLKVPSNLMPADADVLIYVKDAFPFMSMCTKFRAITMTNEYDGYIGIHLEEKWDNSYITQYNNDNTEVTVAFKHVVAAPAARTLKKASK